MSQTDSARVARRVLLCVTGGIAAYKACEVLRGLQKQGCEVRVAATKEALQFVGETTFEALTHYPVASDLFSFAPTSIPHIDLTEWADVVLVVPATANILAKVATGTADTCVSSCLLAATGEVVVAPAMNVHMWENPATQHNISWLRAHDYVVVEPTNGLLACGDIGKGKLAPVEDIVEATLDAVWRTHNRSTLRGKRVLITAGPTHEYIDPVRYLSNASSGKMGWALARAARRAGAKVCLVAGPVDLRAPWGVEMVPVVSAQDMFDATTSAFSDADIAILAAAVADYRPKATSDHKLKKANEPLNTLELIENPDILAHLGSHKQNQFVVGFAAETHDVMVHARVKLERKGCDMLVANDVSRATSTFGSDTNEVTLVYPSGQEELPLMSKDQVADAIMQRISERISKPRSKE